MQLSGPGLVYVAAIAVHEVVRPVVRTVLEALAFVVVALLLIAGYLYALVVSGLGSLLHRGPVS